MLRLLAATNNQGKLSEILSLLDGFSLDIITPEKLGISLGKTNYLLRELIKKGLIKVKGFTETNGRGKLNKVQYNLTFLQFC